MAAWIEMQQVQIFVLESAEWRGEPLYLALLQLLQRQGAAGATAIRALAGFGAHHQLHRATLVDVGAELPIVVVWIDETARVERLLPQVEAMAGNTPIVRMPVLATQRPPLQIAGLTNELRVRDLMTREVVTVKPSATLDEVAELLLHSGVRAVPVVDPERLVGLITDGDLLRRSSARETSGVIRRLLERLHGADVEVNRFLVFSERMAADVMTSPVVTIEAAAPPIDALRLMLLHHVKRLPVLDADGRLVGLIGRTGILLALQAPRDTD